MAFGAGPDATPLPIGVELWYDAGSGAAWNDITPDVILMDTIETGRGKSSEGSMSDPGSITLALNNASKKYSPRNPASPLYGKIGRNTPVRVWIEHGLVVGTNRHYRVHAEVTEWVQKWTTDGKPYTLIEAAGILRRLGQGEPLELSSFRAAARVTPVTAYWPMEDGDNAKWLTPEVGGSNGQLYGAYTLAAYDRFACSDPIPTLGTGRIALPVPYATPTTQWLTRWLTFIPAAGTTNGAALIRVKDSRFGYVDVVYGTGGTLQITAFNTLGTSIASTAAIGFNVNGKQLQIQLSAEQSGGNILFTLATLEPGQSSGAYIQCTATTATVGRPTLVELNPRAVALTDVAVGHVTVDDAVTSLFSLANALNAFDGETGVARLIRLCAENGVGFGYGSFVDSEQLGYQSRGDLVSLLEEAAEVEGGLLSEARSGLNLYMRPVESLYSMTPMASIPFGDGGRVQLEPTEDDQRTRNRVTVARSGGASYTAQDLNGPMGVNKIGLYVDGRDMPLHDDIQAQHQAGWRLNQGTVDEPRYPVISLDLAHPFYLADPTLTRNILLVNIGDMVEVTGLPAWLPPDAVRGIVVGVKEVIQPFSYRIEWNVIPASPYRVPSWDVAGDRYSPLGSTLVSSVTTTGTSLSVASTNTLWTTAAGDRPFDLMIAGERVTVTNVTGASSPQAFTVTRSVNGVVKAQAAGTAIELADPVRWGM